MSSSGAKKKILGEKWKFLRTWHSEWAVGKASAFKAHLPLIWDAHLKGFLMQQICAGANNHYTVDIAQLYQRFGIPALRWVL